METITIKRGRDPAVADMLSKFFVCEDGMSREIARQELAMRMKHYPEDTLVLIASRGPKPVGFMIAWTIPNRDYIWVDQIWYDPMTYRRCQGMEMIDEAVQLIEAWTKIKGKKYIRMQTSRGRSWSRAWGFEEVMVLMQKEVKHV